MPLIFMCFPAPYYASGFPYSNGALHVNNPHTSTRLSPCAGAVLPYVSTATPYSHQAPKTQLQFQRDQRFPAPQTRHPRVSTNSLRRLPARCRMSGRGIKSAETSDRLTQTYASGQLTQIPCANDEKGHGRQGTASLRDASASASASTTTRGA